MGVFLSFEFITLCGKGGHSRPLGKSGHSLPLAATREKRPLAATRVAASGCKWLLFMRLKHLGHASKAATCGHLRPLDRAATCGHLRPLEWLRVAASGCFSEIQIPRRMQPQWEHSLTNIFPSFSLKPSQSGSSLPQLDFSVPRHGSHQTRFDPSFWPASCRTHHLATLFVCVSAIFLRFFNL